MTAKKPAAHKALPPIPLSELPMMRALLLMPAPTAGGKTTRKPVIKGDPKTQLTMLTLTIVNKLQILALRRPQALIIVAQVLDKLLDQQLEVLKDKKHVDRSPTKNRSVSE